MGAPDPDEAGSAGGDAPEQHGSGPLNVGSGSFGRSGGSGDGELAWLQEQLLQLGLQLGPVGVADECEDDEAEWQDPSGGLLPAIFTACEDDIPDELPLLLERLAASEWGVDTPGPDGDTALHLAALYGSDRCAELLLAAGARVAAINAEDGSSALHDAAAGGHDAILTALADAARRQLGEAGGDGGGGGGGGAFAALLDLRDAEGETALHTAARGGHLSTVRLLLALGASPGIASGDGSLPADEADDDDVAALLRDAACGGGAGGGADAAGGGAGAAAGGDAAAAGGGS
ncbi:MAG: ankyrin repeat-containing domain protein [Monoraphidium minutum]|nr:MAG: ankyrin repeat-containing domain protein [Monoraphidium minutum]